MFLKLSVGQTKRTWAASGSMLDIEGTVSKDEKHSMKPKAFTKVRKSMVLSFGAASVVAIALVVVFVCMIVNLDEDHELYWLRGELEHIDKVLHRSSLDSFQVGAWVSIEEVTNGTWTAPKWVIEEGETDHAEVLSLAIDDFEKAFDKTVRRVRGMRKARPKVDLFLISARANVPKIEQTQTEGIANNPADAPPELRAGRQDRALYDPRFFDVVHYIQRRQKTLSRDSRSAGIIGSCFVGFIALLLVLLRLHDVGCIKMNRFESTIPEADVHHLRVPSLCNEEDPKSAVT